MYIEQLTAVSNNNKYLKWYISICLKAAGRATSRAKAKKLLGPVERHHILPRSYKMGGDSDALNQVYLTPKEHFICHLLLTKFSINQYHPRMVRAFMMFRSTNEFQSRKTTSRFYNTLKAQHSLNMKANNPMHDKSIAAKVTATRKKNREAGLEKSNSNKHETLARISERLKLDNPMSNPETIAKMLASRKPEDCGKGMIWMAHPVQQIRKRVKPTELDEHYSNGWVKLSNKLPIPQLQASHSPLDA